MRLIVNRPQHDITTRYLSFWAEEIIILAQKKGLNVVDLVKNKANRTDFEGRVLKLQPRIVFLNGHGDDDRILGHDNEILVKAGDNHRILENKIVYGLSCNAGKILGQKVAQENKSTFIGYVDEFIFLINSNYLTKPLKDPKAKPFMEASNQIMLSLLKGNTAQKASEKSKDKFRQHYKDLLSSEAGPDGLQTAQFLWWNMQNQVCLGDKNAQL